jgi:hypothetical protein
VQQEARALVLHQTHSVCGLCREITITNLFTRKSTRV